VNTKYELGVRIDTMLVGVLVSESSSHNHHPTIIMSPSSSHIIAQKHTHIHCTQITVRVTSTNTVINTSDAYSLDRAHTHSVTDAVSCVLIHSDEYSDEYSRGHSAGKMTSSDLMSTVIESVMMSTVMRIVLSIVQGDDEYSVE
jgi:uncharacterized protein YqgV (UPF0045/DUF77 family)